MVQLLALGEKRYSEELQRTHTAGRVNCPLQETLTRHGEAWVYLLALPLTSGFPCFSSVSSSVICNNPALCGYKASSCHSSLLSQPQSPLCNRVEVAGKSLKGVESADGREMAISHIPHR
jgi:hypothetical protein